VDVLVSEEHAMPLEEAFQRFGYSALVRSEIFARYRHSSSTLEDVDVLYVNNETAEEMSRQATECLLDGTPCRIPAISHLLALKLHAIRNNPAREPRDFADIVELLRANAGTIARDDLQALCARYGPEGLWRKLEEALWKRS
jgi:hypothetical protein